MGINRRFLLSIFSGISIFIFIVATTKTETIILRDIKDATGTHNIVHNDTHSSNIDNACLHVMHTELPTLISTLKEDLDGNGLRPITQQGMVHKGLNMSVLRGKRLLLIGDSTTYYITKYIYLLMKKKGNSTILPSHEYTNLTLEDAAKLITERLYKLKISHPSNSFHGPHEIKDIDGTWIKWIGFAGPGMHNYSEKLDFMFSNAEEMKPDIIIANMAFHWLHLCDLRCPGTARPGPGKSISSNVIKLWLEYKENWLQRLHKLAIKANSSLLLYKTANYICDDKRTGQFSNLSSLYLKNDSSVLENCFNKASQLKINVTLSDRHQYCKLGAFTERGSQYLNKQVIEFVDDLLHKQRQKPILSTSVGLLDDHSIQGCWSTDVGDGVHHKQNAMLLRLRLMINTIESYLRCDGNKKK